MIMTHNLLHLNVLSSVIPYHVVYNVLPSHLAHLPCFCPGIYLTVRPGMFIEVFFDRILDLLLRIIFSFVHSVVCLSCLSLFIEECLTLNCCFAEQKFKWL